MSSGRQVVAAVAGAVALGALGVGVGLAAAAAPAGSTASTTMTTSTVAKPTQSTVTGKVTKVSTSGHYFVVNGKTVFVTSKTTYRLIHGGLGGIKVNRRYKVVVTQVNGKYTVVSVTRL